MNCFRFSGHILVVVATFFGISASASTVTLFPIKYGQPTRSYPNQTLSVTCQSEELSKVIQSSYDNFLGKAAEQQKEGLWKLENTVDDAIFFNYKADDGGGVELFAGVTVLTGKRGVGNSFRVYLQSGNGCAITTSLPK